MGIRGKLAAVAAAITIIGAGASVAHADNIEADADNIAAGQQSSISLGNLACNGTATASVPVWLTRNGNYPGNQVFQNGAVVTITAPDNSADVGVTLGQGTITLPADWSSTPTGGTHLFESTSTVTAAAGIPGAHTATITYTATGAGSNGGGSTVSRTSAITVSWTTNSCLSTSAVTVTCPTNATPYTGLAITPCTARVTGSGGLDQALSVSYSSNVNVGTVTASASFPGDATHSGSSGSATFSISKASSTTTVSCPASVNWTGLAQTPCTAAVTGAGGLNGVVTPSYLNNTDVGTATASASYAGDTNHNASSDSKTFAISTAATTVTVSCPASVTYTGTAFTPCTATATGAGGLNVTIDPSTIVYTNNTNAGTAQATASFAGDATHASASGVGSFTIGKASSTVALDCPTSVTYTGATLKPCTATATGAGGLNVTIDPSTIVYTTNTNVGTAGASVSWAGDANHTGASDSKSFTIAKAPSAVVITCGSATYTGTTQTPCTAKATGAGMSDVLLSVSYTDNTAAGQATASASWPGDTNHTGSSGSQPFTIAKATSTVTLTCPDSVPYTGSARTPCTAEATGAGGLQVALDAASIVYTENVTVGTAHASVTWGGDANHDGDSDSATFAIGKASSSVHITCLPVTYTGDPVEPCSATVSGAGTVTGTATLVYSNNVNAGATASVTATYAGDDNHVGSQATTAFTIDKASSAVHITCLPASYTGSPVKPCSASVNGAGTVNGEASLTYTNNTNAGTNASVVATYSGDANHLGSSDTTTFTIDKATSSIAITCTPATYTGAAVEPCTAIVSGAGTVTGQATLNYADNVHAGVNTATVTANYAGDANHGSSSYTRTFTIAKASSFVTVLCPVSVTYNGAAQEPCSATATGAGMGVVNLEPSYASNVNVGTATASASWPGDNDHLLSTGSETFAIGPATPVVTLTCPVLAVYNGLSHDCTATVKGIGTELDSATATITYSANGNINAGQVTATANYAGNNNYNAAHDEKTFTIAKANPVVTLTCPANAVYNGLAHDCTATVKGVGTELDSATAAITYSANGNVNAGQVTATANYAGSSNYNPASDQKSFTIAKAGSAVSISCPASVTYTSLAQTPCTAEATGAGITTPIPVSPSYTGNTNAGTAHVTASWAGDDNHTGSNHATAFTIDKAASTVSISCGTPTYTSSALTPCTYTLGGPGPFTATAVVTYTNNTNAGDNTAWVKVVYPGDDNHNGSEHTTSFSISKAASTVVVACPGHITYTGDALEPCTATASGAGLAPFSRPVGYGNNTNAGTASASASWDGDDNHTSSADSKTFTIDKAGSTVSISCPANVTYTGSAHTPCTAEATGAGIATPVPVTPGYMSNTNAGTATVTASWDGDANHTGNTKATTFTIDKAPTSVAVTCAPGPFIYTGTDQGTCTATVTGVNNLSQPAVVTYDPNRVGPGTVKAIGTYAGGANYLASSNFATYSIGAWTLNGFYQPVDMTPAGGLAVYNTVKGGSTVPLKFEVFAGETELTAISAVKSFVASQVGCTGGATEDAIELTTTGGTTLRYDTTAGQFIQNWQTPKAAGNCYRVTMTTQDGSSLNALFKTK